MGPVRVGAGLTVFVIATWLGSLGLGVLVMPWHGDWVAAGVAALLVAAMAAYAVPSFGGVNRRWSASGFFHLAFSFTVGPPAILAMAIGESLGFAVRRRPGLFRTAFNLSDHFLADSSAWVVFQAVAALHVHPLTVDPLRLAAAGIAGSIAEAIVNRALLTMTMRLAHEPSTLSTALRNLSQSIPIVLPFGITAAAAVLLYGKEGTWGIVTLLMPIAMVQASMVALSRRAHEKTQAQEREARALRGEAKASRVAADALRRAGEASEVERKRIAADLHDSVIQDVSGLLFRSSAMLGRLSDGDASVWSREGVEEFLSYTHGLAAEAVRELRTLMVELAPPLLDQEGLASALRQLLTRLDREQITWELQCCEDPLDQRHQRLVYRVVQEALRNVIQHAQCHTVWVTVRVDGDRLLASIRDDGRGFSAAERAERRKKGHAGLGLLVQTARDGGGEVSITSHPGRGTRVELSVPMLPAPLMDEAAPDKQTGIPVGGAIVVGDELSGDLGADGHRAEQPVAPAAIGRGPRTRKAPERAPAVSSRVP
jgi:signal transduction histidine kinase